MQEKLPTVLGDFLLIQKIGAGALGDTFVADHRFTKKTFVLKLLAPELVAQEDFLSRFENQVALIARIEHPHFLKIHSVSEDENRYFFVTEQVEGGQDLNHYLEGKTLTEKEIYSILWQVAEAIDFAHTQGFVCNSLKLSNLIIDKGGKVYLGERGLANIVGEASLFLRALPFHEINTLQSTELGRSLAQSFSFMAPEQLQGQSSTPSTDIYAFGVLAYFLLTESYPEGLFDLPSTFSRGYFYEWDELIRSTLAFYPEKRAQSLMPLMQKIQSPPLDRPTSFPEQEAREEPSAPVFLQTVKVEVDALLPVGLMQEMESTKAQQEYEKALHGMLHREPVVQEYHPEPQERKSTISPATPMVEISSGRYFRGENVGNRDESPRHEVLLSSFSIDIHPVTNEQFVAFLEHMNGEKDKNYNDLIRLKDSRLSRSAGRLFIESGYAKHPVVGITWYGAVAYAEWLGKRLPTEAEWEVAAAGGIVNAIYPTGEEIEKNQANFFSSDTTAVKSYPPNDYGLYDMAGNIYEWCQDWYSYNYYENSLLEPENPQGPHQGVYRVLRGGCWKSLKEDLRLAHRHRNNPGAVNSTYGFRCVQ